MEELGLELKNRRFVRVLFCKINAESECATFPYGIKWPVYDCLPLVHVILIRHSVYALVIALLQLLKILHQLPLRSRRHNNNIIVLS